MKTFEIRVADPQHHQNRTMLRPEIKPYTDSIISHAGSAALNHFYEFYPITKGTNLVMKKIPEHPV